MNILLTGGAGFIGSHTAIALLDAGHNVVIYDNFINSSRNIQRKLESISGKEILVVEGDIRNVELLESVMAIHDIEAAIHFAGLKSVGDSVQNPIEYYDNNVSGTISLLRAMTNQKIYKLIFSSSATVYGDPKWLPIDEQHPLAPTSPYGKTKLYIEGILEDLARTNSFWKIVSLRYFNPVGGHKSGFLGERPNVAPNNLMPYITQVAKGELPYLNIFGSDYETRDGTGVRDYVHVMDLAEGHLAALDYMPNLASYETFNLGTGTGYSVLEILSAFEKINKVKVEHRVVNRRPGDIASCYAGIQLAKAKLNWQPARDLINMCQSSWISALADEKNNAE